MANKNMCCLTTPITDQHLNKFNKCMYDEDESDETETDHGSDSN